MTSSQEWCTLELYAFLDGTVILPEQKNPKKHAVAAAHSLGLERDGSKLHVPAADGQESLVDAAAPLRDPAPPELSVPQPVPAEASEG